MIGFGIRPSFRKVMEKETFLQSYGKGNNFANKVHSFSRCPIFPFPFTAEVPLPYGSFPHERHPLLQMLHAPCSKRYTPHVATATHPV